MGYKEVLIFLAVKHHGDWDEIFNAIQNREFGTPEEIQSVIKNIKSKVLTILDDNYPEHLKGLYRPPFVLFYYGDISLIDSIENNIAVIGSRDYSEYGKNMTQYLVKDICARYIVVSGLARGIDGIAHRTSVENGGKTIAVLGSGIDYCHPKENLDIYNEIKTNHLLISEYPNDEVPKPEYFPWRNRLIAAFSKGLLVTEAHSRSGTQITVEFALQMNREIMCVPYRITDETFNNKLISEGAYLVESGEDIAYIMK